MRQTQQHPKAGFATPSLCQGEGWGEGRTFGNWNSHPSPNLSPQGERNWEMDHTRIGPVCKGVMHTRHARGSAIILVAVTLALMAMLGAAYIQLARVDRITSRQARRTGQIDAVVQGAISQIQSVLRNDLLDDNGNFFNPSNPTTGGADEPYDYPQTNNLATFSPVPKKIDGSIFTIPPVGGQLDDTWLASTTPDFSTPATPLWPHITNLNGVFLHNGTDKDLTTVAFPVEEAVTNTVATPQTWDTGLDVTSGFLVDADGDGVPDSRWTWAPIPKAGNVMYVMAVRIIDNSSLINANVALSQVDSTGAYDNTSVLVNGGGAPRWSSPSELDLGAFIWSFPQTNRMTELEELLSHRLYSSLSTPPSNSSAPRIPWGSSLGERRDFWLKGPRLYGKFDSVYQALTTQDELELRYRNGLNNANRKLAIETDVDLDSNTAGNQSGLYTVLRQGGDSPVKDVPISELHYRHFTDGYDWPSHPTQKQFIATSAVLAAAHDTTKIKQFFEQEPRHQITTRSGAAVYASPLPGETGRQLKTDLNIASAATLSADIKLVLDSGGTYTHPLGWTTQQTANQFAACIKDYADSDNRLTAVGPVGSERYGLEALPFVTEVYVQGLYEVTTATENPPASGTWDLTWGRQGVTGYAIEIRNPFRKPILLTEVSLWVNGSNWGTLDSLAGKTALGVDEVLILYRHSNNNITSDDTVTSLWNTSDPFITTVALTNNWPSTSSDINVELRATDSPGNPIAWAYAVALSKGMPSTVNDTGVACASNPLNLTDYLQRISLGNGNGINMLAITSSEFIPNDKTLATPPPSPQREPTRDSLGTADKIATGGPGNKVNPTTNQVLIADYADGKIVQVGELAHIAAIGPDATNTVADVWGSATNTADFMLDFASTQLVSTTVDSMALPHAVVMLDRFTTLSPAGDGVDNDPDTADADEQLVPGTINLNTVVGLYNGTTIPPDHLLRYVLPIPDPATRDTVIRSILEYRDKLASFSGTNRGLGANYRDRLGISNIGELMKCLDTVLSNDTVDNFALTGTVIDFNSVNDNGTLGNLTDDFVVADGIVDDREEEAMVASWLAQVCSTRSDIFTAYVLIQGYPADDFTQGPVESIRFFAVLDRSGVVGQNSPVRVLGVYRMD